jgi:hypothetical protein
MTKLFNLLFSEPSSSQNATRKITLLRILVAVVSHLYINPIGTIGLVLYWKYRTWPAAGLSVAGFILTTLASNLPNHYRSLGLRLSVRADLDRKSRDCTLRRRSVWDYLRKDEIEGWFAGFEGRSGRMFSKIYRHTVEWARVFEYNLSDEGANKMDRGEPPYYFEHPYAHVDQQGYAYVFIPAVKGGRIGPLSRFQAAHEIGHVFFSAAITKMGDLYEPAAICMTLGFAALNLQWSALSGTLVVALGVVMLQYFTPREQYLRKLGRLMSECMADSFAVLALNDIEKKAVITRLEDPSRNDLIDNELTAEMNAARRFRLIQELRGESVDYGEASLVNTLEPLWKCSLVCGIAYSCCAPTWKTVVWISVLAAMTAIALYIMLISSQLIDEKIVSRAEAMVAK